MTMVIIPYSLFFFSEDIFILNELVCEINLFLDVSKTIMLILKYLLVNVSTHLTYYLYEANDPHF